MAIVPETAFPGKITPSSAAFPQGEARDVTVAGDGTGTPWKALLLNDLFGFQQAILAEAGVTPSGSSDTALVSQYLQGLKSVIGTPVTNMLGLVSIPSAERIRANMLGFFATFPQSVFDGGGEFIWQEDLNKNLANGGTIIDPDNLGGFDGTVSTRDAFLTAQGGGVGVGCWVRLYEGAVYVTWFGTVSDYVDGGGGTDNTSAFQAAIDAANGLLGSVFIPAGSYGSGQLNLDTSLLGESQFTKLYCTVAAVDFITLDVAVGQYLNIEKLWIKGTGQTSGTCFSYTGNDNHDNVFRDINIFEFGSAFFSTQHWMTRYEKVRINECDIGFNFDGTTGGFTTLVFSQCYVQTCKVGIFLSACNGGNIAGFTVDLATEHPMRLLNNRGVSLDSIYLELCVVPIASRGLIDLFNNDSMTISNIFLWNNTAADAGALYLFNYIGTTRSLIVKNVYSNDYTNHNLAIIGPTTTKANSTLSLEGIPAAMDVLLYSGGDITLVEHKEGSWTPEILFGGANVGMTAPVQVGRYTKIGNLVTASCSINLSAKGSSVGDAVISGLPYTSENVAGVDTPAAVWLIDVTFADFPMARNTPNSATVNLEETTNGGVSSLLTEADFSDTSKIQISIAYRV